MNCFNINGNTRTTTTKNVRMSFQNVVYVYELFEISYFKSKYCYFTIAWTHYVYQYQKGKRNEHKNGDIAVEYWKYIRDICYAKMWAKKNARTYLRKLNLKYWWCTSTYSNGAHTHSIFECLKKFQPMSNAEVVFKCSKCVAK